MPATRHANPNPSSSSSPPAKPQPEESSSFLIPPHPLSTSRYHRQVLVPSISIRGQGAIARAKVLIIGLGGLGSPASLYLAAAGIGTLGLVDADVVELSNLHRQIVHTEAGVGTSKVESALRTLREHNSDRRVRYIRYRTAFGAGNAVEIVEGKAVAGLLGGVGEMVEGGYDVVLDCTDNPATRYLISDVCVVTGRVLVSAAAQRGEGQLMRLCYPPPRPSSSPADSNHDEGKKKARTGELAGDKGPCYRCVFPTPPPPETVQSCSEIGILGPVVGVMGTLMAMEVLKIVTAAAAARKTGQEEGEQENSWRPTLLLYNALSPDPRATFRSVGLRKAARRDCLACGDEGLLSSRENGKEKKKKVTRERIERGDVDYLAWCGSSRVEEAQEGDGGFLERKRRIGAGEFVERMRREVGAGGDDGDVRENLESLVVDVREEVEYELGTKVKGSINIPISRILRHGQAGNHDDDDGAGAANMELEQLLQESSPPAKKSDHDNTTTAIYFVCQRGNDSQVAARRFLDAESQLRSRFGSSSRGTRWIGDVVGGFEALQRYLGN